MPNPRTVLPESPRKTFAGGRLDVRKPEDAPNKASPKQIAKTSRDIPGRTANATAKMADVPAAIPSAPSRKFTEFVKATTTSETAT